LVNGAVEVGDLEGLGSLGRIYASPSVAIAGTVRKPSDEAILLFWTLVSD
jgi:hypothetical protein